jgi:hypothetical protein
MESIFSMITVVLGLLLRLGLPVLFTVLFVVLLRHLDARWQQEGIGKVSVLAHNTRCWEQHNCSEEKRAKCAAYLHPETPCWQLYRSKDGNLREQCLGCQTFRSAPVPVRS